MNTMDLERVLASAPVYYHNYIRKAGEGDLLANMKTQIAATRQFFGETCREKRDFRYAEGKWTPTEILGHLTDSERVFQYRAMRFARTDQTELPGFDENIYVPASYATERGMASILDEFEHLRWSGIYLLESLPEEARWREGLANGKPISVYALFMANVGHVNHHVGVIRERYL